MIVFFLGLLHSGLWGTQIKGGSSANHKRSVDLWSLPEVARRPCHRVHLGEEEPSSERWRAGARWRRRGRGRARRRSHLRGLARRKLFWRKSFLLTSEVIGVFQWWIWNMAFVEDNFNGNNGISPVGSQDVPKISHLNHILIHRVTKKCLATSHLNCSMPSSSQRCLFVVCRKTCLSRARAGGGTHRREVLQNFRWGQPCD